MRQTGPIGRHAVPALDGANRDRVFVRALVAHDPDALNRQEHREALPQPRVPVLALDLLRDHVVGAAKQIESVGGDLAENADRQAGPRKWLPHYELFFEAELPADLANFVL